MNVLLLGANSDIANAVARKFAVTEKAHLTLASRNTELLEKKAADLKLRYGVGVDVVEFNAVDYDSHQSFYQSLTQSPDVVVLAFGYIGDQQAAIADFGVARKILETNLIGAMSILEVVAKDFEARGHGQILAIGSVAGNRGRVSNYMYGAAKGGLSVYLSGLRNRLCKRNVHVMTVLPGFVRTKMTENLDLPEKLVASPDQVADDIYKGFQKGKDILYTRWFWRWIMLIITSIPEKIFKRMSL